MINNQDLVDLIDILIARPDAHSFIDEDLICHIEDLGLWDSNEVQVTPLGRKLIKPK